MSKKEEEFREANRKAAEREAERKAAERQKRITEDRNRENERISREYQR